MIVRLTTLGLLLFAATANATQLTLVRSCPLDDRSQVGLLAESTVEGNRFHLKIDGTVGTAFTDMPDTDFIGTIALAKCVDRSLVFAISYGPPYLKGAVVRKNPVSHRLERIDFSEKALPRWLYINSREMHLVIPNIGHEVASRYLVYHYSASDGQSSEPAARDTLPSRRGFEKLEISRQMPDGPGRDK